jgi:hypothetical protein
MPQAKAWGIPYTTIPLPPCLPAGTPKPPAEGDSPSAHPLSAADASALPCLNESKSRTLTDIIQRAAARGPTHVLSALVLMI